MINPIVTVKAENKSLKAGMQVQLSSHGINFFGRTKVNAHFKNTPLGQLPIGEVIKIINKNRVHGQNRTGDRSVSGQMIRVKVVGCKSVVTYPIEWWEPFND